MIFRFPNVCMRILERKKRKNIFGCYAEMAKNAVQHSHAHITWITIFRFVFFLKNHFETKWINGGRTDEQMNGQVNWLCVCLWRRGNIQHHAHHTMGNGLKMKFHAHGIMVRLVVELHFSILCMIVIAAHQRQQQPCANPFSLNSIYISDKNHTLTVFCIYLVCKSQLLGRTWMLMASTWTRDDGSTSQQPAPHVKATTTFLHQNELLFGNSRGGYTNNNNNNHNSNNE